MCLGKNIKSYTPLTIWLNRLSTHTKSLLLVCLILSNTGCTTKTHELPDIADVLIPKQTQDTVILLHGMWRDADAMEPAENFLSQQGYHTLNLSYPSTEKSIEVLVRDYLHPAVEKLQSKQPENIHFVTHSMGGILVRYYLEHYDIPALGRVVMLSPPNKGSQLSNIVLDLSWLDWLIGPAAQQLATHEQSWVNQLQPVGFDLGVIAGNYNPNWLTSWLLPGEDDGVVSMENTKVEGMQDFLVVSEEHFELRKYPPVLQQVAYYLQHGQFYR